MAELVKIADKNDFKEGQGKIIQVKGKTIALFLHEGNFYAIDNTCKHMGGPLGEGELEDGNVVCPWHGWKYNIKTGVNALIPSIKVNTYDVKVDGNDVKIEI